MIERMNILTDMPDWHHKVFDPDFTFEWKSAKLMTGHDVTRSMVEWVGWRSLRTWFKAI